MSFIARSTRFCIAARRISRGGPQGGILCHRTYATSTRTYPARSAASTSRVTKAPASTNTNEISREDISEAVADVAGVREVLKNDVPPENGLSPESGSLRVSQIAFPGDFVSGSDNGASDWSKSYHGLSVEAFPREIAEILLSPLDQLDIEIKPGASHSSSLSITPDLFHRRRTYLPSRN